MVELVAQAAEVVVEVVIPLHSRFLGHVAES